MNNTTFPIFIFLLLLFSISCNDNKLILSNIQIENSEINIGEIGLNDTIKVEYQIVNPSDTELLVLGIEPSCGCTSVKLLDKSIQPKSKSILFVDFIADKEGAIEKYIVLKSNTNPPFTP